MKSSLPALSRREREIMEIVFGLQKATLSEIQQQMSEAPTRPALRSLLTILEGKGHLRHHKEGREFVYEAVQSREKVGQSTLKGVISTFFGGSLSQALASYLNDPKSRLNEPEIAELAAFIEEARTRHQSRPNKKDK